MSNLTRIADEAAGGRKTSKYQEEEQEEHPISGVTEVWFVYQSREVGGTFIDPDGIGRTFNFGNIEALALKDARVSQIITALGIGDKQTVINFKRSGMPTTGEAVVWVEVVNGKRHLKFGEEYW